MLVGGHRDEAMRCARLREGQEEQMAKSWLGMTEAYMSAYETYDTALLR